MKSMTFAIVATTLTACAAVCLTVTADETKQKQRSGERDRVGHLDGKTSGTNVRASQMIGHDIQNAEGKNVGQIHDIVLNARTGKIRYVAVTYGGLLGVGDKLFAVPYEALKCKADPEDRDETIVVLDVTREKLDGAQGFDQDHWPNFADQKFTAELDKRYGVDRTRRDRPRDRDRDRPRNRSIDVDVDKDGVDVDVKPNNPVKPNADDN